MARTRFFSVLLAVLTMLVLGWAPGCGQKRSAIMLAVSTDMKAPKDVSAISITVSTNNTVKHNILARVAPNGDVLLPSTLAIVEPDDPNASVRIRAMAFQERRARVLRDVRTSIPAGGRVSFLRIALNFVNDGSTTGELPEGALPSPSQFDPFVFVPNCPNPEHTWVDGACVDSYVDPATLPEFDAAAVGSPGRAAGCFDAKTCFAEATPLRLGDEGGEAALALNEADCSVELRSADPATLNFAFVTPDVGDCVKDGECYVPIERGSGWDVTGSKAKVSSFVCTLVKQKNLRLAASTRCASQTEKVALCIESPPGANAPAPLQGSFIALEVDGKDLSVPCDHLDEDFASKPPDEVPGTNSISESTGITWAVRFPRTGESFASKSASGRYPVRTYDGLRSDDPDLSIEVKLPAGSVEYVSEGKEASPTSFHDVSIEDVRSTETTATYRIRGSFEGTMTKTDRSVSPPRVTFVPFAGAWSLLVTYPRSSR